MRFDEDLQATTLPPNLPTPNTLPQSRPSTLTLAHPVSSPAGTPFILVLACSLMPSSPPSTTPGSSSGFCNPSHLLSIFKFDVATEILREPCILAEIVSLELEDGVCVEACWRMEAVVGESASFVKRSEMALSCRRGGSMICTSGSRHDGSWICATVAAARTATGMDCVIVVSRSCWKWKSPCRADGSANSSSSSSGPGNGRFGASSGRAVS